MKKVYLVTSIFSMSAHSQRKSVKTSPAKSTGSTEKTVKEYTVYSDNESVSTGTSESGNSNNKNEVDSNSTPTSVKPKQLSKSLRKKFFHYFPNVEDDEEVLNRYACALLSDILLQGSLYITTNYFGFYSNVFGYVTKLLIPILTVEDITKEKTAKIFNNAIGIVTPEQKHVFGSLISRDSAFEFMRAVWEKAKSEAELLEKELVGQGLNYCDAGEEEDEVDEEETYHSENNRRKVSRKISTKIAKYPKPVIHFKKFKRHGIILPLTIVLLVVLYASAALLLYRISRMQDTYYIALENVENSDSHSIYRNILELQSELYSKSTGATYGFLDSNLDQIAKVKKSLEALYSLMADIKFSNEFNSSPHQRGKS